MFKRFSFMAPWQEFGEYADPNTFETKTGWYRPGWFFYRYPNRGWTLGRIKRPT